MKIGALAFWEKMHSNGTPIESIVLAAWHWPSSITWRWSLTKSPHYTQGKSGFSFMRTYKGRGLNFLLNFNSRITGMVSLKTQPNMWKKK